MKKITKLSALLLVAAVFFAGCKEPGDSTGGANTTPLFSESDTTVDIEGSEIELYDGDWSFKELTSFGSDSAAIVLDVTVTNGVPEVTKGSLFSSGTIPEGASEEEIAEEKAMAEAQGLTFTISGNKYTVSGDFNEEGLKMYSSMFMYLPYSDFETLKTNEDKTKYYATEKAEQENSDGTYTEGTVKYYLMKK